MLAEIDRQIDEIARNAYRKHFGEASLQQPVTFRWEEDITNISLPSPKDALFGIARAYGPLIGIHMIAARFGWGLGEALVATAALLVGPPLLRKVFSKRSRS